MNKEYYKAGKILDLKNKIAISDDIGQGFGFKDEEAFVKKTGICYIPEHSFESSYKDNEEQFTDSFSYSDFLQLAKNFKERNNIPNKYTVEMIARNLFESVDWQYPSSLIADWENSDIFCE